MSSYPLRYFGDPVLKQRAREVEELSGGLQTLVHGMYETMDLEEGLGLAAPQVGVRKRIFTYDLHEGDGPAVLINPEVVLAEGEIISEEGCLSIPDMRFEVVRHERITVRGIDLASAADCRLTLSAADSSCVCLTCASFSCSVKRTFSVSSSSASTLPRSTPHWSNGLIPQSTPAENVRCS